MLLLRNSDATVPIAYESIHQLEDTANVDVLKESGDGDGDARVSLLKEDHMTTHLRQHQNAIRSKEAS